MKKYFSTFFTVLVLATSAANADNYSELAAYKSGDSLEWFYDLRTESLSRPKSRAVEARILAVLESKPVSDGAFKSACEILKPIASSDSIAVLAKFLKSEFRAPWVCDVLLSLKTSEVDTALVSALEGANEKISMDIISTLASRGSLDGLKVALKYSDDKNEKLAVFAVYALGKFLDSSAVEALSEIAKKNDFRKKAAIETLAAIAFDAFKAGEKALARSALEVVPADFGSAVVVRAGLAGDKYGEYLDSLIINGVCVREAGRAMSGKRKWSKSGALVKAFPNLPKDAKLAAMGTFMTSGDTRFYPLAAPLIDSGDKDLRDEAVYLARFIASDEDSLRKIYPMMKSGERILSGIARNVFEENPSLAAAKILNEKAESGDLDALQILVKRGDISARNRLMKMYFDEDGFRNSKISQAVENTIAWGEMKAFVSRYKDASEELKKDIVKVIIKKLAKSRDKMYIAEAAYEILDGNIAETDPMYKFIASKLKVRIQKRKDVWQGEYRQRAVSDSEMKVATLPEPNLEKGFVSLFDGKTLKGWKTSTGIARYSVENGCIAGLVVPAQKDKDGNFPPESKRNSFLITERSDYFDFIFSVEFKFEVDSNSGVMFRGRFKNNGSVVGPQAEIDDNMKRRWTAGVYDEGAIWKYSVSRADQAAARGALKHFDWNRMTIECRGDNIRTWLNGVPVSDFIWKGTTQGFFGLQVHVAKEGKILWRNIKVKELK